MTKGPKPATPEQALFVEMAHRFLLDARDNLKEAGVSDRCIESVRRAINSVEGAKRHMSARRRAHDAAEASP
jgi:hypothetical protein